MALPVITVDLVARIAKFESEMNRAAQVSQRNFDLMRRSADTVRSAIGALAAAFTVRAMVQFVTTITDVGDALDETSQKVGTTVEFLSGIQNAAKLSGLGVEELNKALVKLNVTLTEARGGSREQAGAFATLGLDPAKLVNTEQALLAIADRFANLEDNAGKTAVAVKLFGRSGAEMIPFLNQGKEGITALVQKMTELGVVWDAKGAKEAAKFNDQLDMLSATIRGIGTDIVKSMLPALTEFATAVQKAVKEGNLFVATIKSMGAAGKAIVFGPTPTAMQQQIDFVKKLRQEIADLKRGASTATDPLGIMQGGPFASGRLRDKKIAELNLTLSQAEASLKRMQNEAAALDSPAAAATAAKKKGVLVDPEVANKAREAAERSVKERQRVAKELDDYERELRRDNYEDIFQQNDKVLQDRLQQDERAAEERIRIEQRAAEEQKQIAKELDEYQRDLQLRTTQESIEASERLQRQLEDNKKKADTLAETAGEIGYSFASAFEEAVLAGEKFSDIMTGLLKDIARTVLHMTVTKRIAGATSSILDDVLKGIFGGVAGGATGSDSGGRRRAGEPVMIGRGAQPELFVPEEAGSYYPNWGGRGGGMQLSVNIDARGADAGAASRMRLAVPGLINAVKASINDDKRRRK